MMTSNVQGRLRNTHVPYPQALVPVYEAVANSIHAIEDGVGLAGGRIQVVLGRSPGVHEDAEPETWIIESLQIKDNGVGFTSENWDSFNEADSRLKESRGGRGLGRFTWLKVFRKAKVESYFVENGQTRVRSFVFKRSREGIEDVSEGPASGPPHTSNELYGPGDDYRRAMPTTAVGMAERLVEHFLPQLVLRSMPRLTVSDPAVGVEIDLHQTFGALVDDTRVDEIQVAGFDFELTHFIVTPDKKSEHAIALTANGRKVEEWTKLNKDLTDLKGSLSMALEYAGGDGELDPHLKPFIGKDNVYYAGYLSGSFLDQHVDPGNRLSIRFPRSTTTPVDETVVTESALRSAVVDHVKDYLAPFLRPLREAAERRVFDKVETEFPQFRAVVARRPEVLDQISVGDTDAKIEKVLYNTHRDLRHDAVITASKIQEASADEIESGRFEGFAELWNDLQKDELARYVIHRRTTLDILETYLQADPEKGVALEDQVHKLIYPMRTSSTQVDPDAQNLWLIDERLAFHRFLASDVPLKKFEVAEIDSPRRPDLAVFNSRVALVGEDSGPYSAISIFEFKKPRRDDYRGGDDKKNPLQQLFDYVEEIRAGKALTVNHRQIEVSPERTRFFLYLVADITPTLRKIILQRSFHPTADEQGYYQVVPALNAYVEVLGWDKLVRDARKRNEVLFHKLGLPKNLTP
ncbi:MAG: hypothetical protein AAF170_16355 [Bacteroidota bacterium]